MQYWLIKSEPNVWSIDQQKKAGSKGITWDGVRNYQAANNLKKMKKGDENYFKLPKPILKKGGCNLSFAGLKTAVLKVSKSLKNEKEKYHLAASFQKTINEILYEKTKIAMKEFLKVKQNKKNKDLLFSFFLDNLQLDNF